MSRGSADHAELDGRRRPIRSHNWDELTRFLQEALVPPTANLLERQGDDPKNWTQARRVEMGNIGYGLRSDRPPSLST